MAEAPAVPEAAAPVEMEEAPAPVLALPAPPPAPSPSRAIFPEPRATLIPAGRHTPMSLVENEDYEHPSLELLAEPPVTGTEEVDADVLEQNALNLQQTVQDFGVRGDILAVRPGPVVTLYELEPAPGTKSSRVIGLSDDIARSMSAVSARVAVVPGRNVIGIELPNETRETVYLRELLSSADFCISKHKLALCLGKNIGGEPIIADLAKMPHLLVAGTTGSGKSVAINTMILSLLYRMKPEECRLIMVDPKMLELSVMTASRTCSPPSSPIRRRRSSPSNGPCARWKSATRRCPRSRSATSMATMPGWRKRGPRARSSPARSIPASTARPARPCSRRRRWTYRPCPTSSSWSTRWPT